MSTPDPVESSRLAEKAQLEADWSNFERHLAQVLGILQEDQFLILPIKKRSHSFVQFAAQGTFGLRAETVSNNYLPGDKKLTEEQITILLTLGWLAPTGAFSDGNRSSKTDFSPNFYREFPRAVTYEDAAHLAVRTFREVLDVSHPGFLYYEAFDINDRSILLPTLGLSTPPKAVVPSTPAAEDVAHVRKVVLDAVRSATGNAEIEFNEDGDIPIRFGSALVFVRVIEEPLHVGVFSPVLTKIEGNDVLFQRVNDLNLDLSFARLFVTDEAVIAAVDVFAQPIVAQHITRACEILGHVADKVDDELQSEFGGRTAFGEFRPNPRHPRRIGF